MDTSLLRQAHTDLVALIGQADEVRQRLEDAVQAPPGHAHQVAVLACVPPSRLLRSYAQGVATSIGAAEAVR